MHGTESIYQYSFSRSRWGFNIVGCCELAILANIHLRERERDFDSCICKVTGRFHNEPCLPALWHAPCFRRLLEDTKNKFVCSPLQQDASRIGPRTSDRTATSSSALAQLDAGAHVSLSRRSASHHARVSLKAINHNLNRRMTALHRMKPHSEPLHRCFESDPH